MSKVKVEVDIIDGGYCDCYEESCIFLDNFGAEGVVDICTITKGAVHKGHKDDDYFVKHARCPNPTPATTARIIQLKGSFAPEYYAIEITQRDKTYVLQTASHNYPSDNDDKGYSKEGLCDTVESLYQELCDKINK